MADTTRDTVLEEATNALIEAQRECRAIREKLRQSVSPESVKILATDYDKAYNKFRRLFRDFITLKEELRGEDQ